jgi:hypothetical protein|tara:strand:+ start:2053 stop:2754 length:702 start_codon:yes stop_codon:yes gene_type:complete
MRVTMVDEGTSLEAFVSLPFEGTLPWIPDRFKDTRKEFLGLMNFLGLSNLSNAQHSKATTPTGDAFIFALTPDEKNSLDIKFQELLLNADAKEIVSDDENYNQKYPNGWYCLWPMEYFSTVYRPNRSSLPKHLPLLRQIIEEIITGDEIASEMSVSPVLVYEYGDGSSILINPYYGDKLTNHSSVSGIGKVDEVYINRNFSNYRKQNKHIVYSLGQLRFSSSMVTLNYPQSII